MKKLVVTLDIGAYLPEITRYTFPMMRTWAAKIGAEFLILTERKLTKPGDGKPLNFEKFQLQQVVPNYDWTYFLDSDAFVHPDTPDWVEMVHDKSVVLFSGTDPRTTRFRATNYTRRARCHIGACTWNVICSDWTGADLWQPPEHYDEAVANIVPIWNEVKTGHCPHAHLIDDYQLSENIARFGLKTTTMKAICEEHKIPFDGYAHLYNCDPYDKLREIRRQLDLMGVKYE